ncbi:MAG TPA: FtsQ-type POTRA domain-containing protein [Kofleriaceae bacterium]|nr:FtsQ-type POTRA domain-containing protein [Kofleriaceae bacterium]
MALRERLPDRARLRAACGTAARAAKPGAITLGVIALAAAAIFLGYRWLTGSSRFALAGVEVRGVHQLAEADVALAVRPSLGENLFRLPLDAIERRLRAEPWVADVSVRRRLPDQLVVDIDEHHAAAVIDLDGLYLADASGHVFKRADVARGEANGLPVVTGVARDVYRRRPDEAQEIIRAALAAAATYAAGPDRPALGEVHRDPDRGLTLYTRRPVVALHLGRPAGPDELRRRLSLFDAAWAALAPAERAALQAIHLDRDGAPVRVTVAFAEPR